MTSDLSTATAGLPSPDPALASFNLGQWLRDVGLAWFPWDITIHAYAICILVGIVLAVLITNHRLTKRGAEKWVVVDIAIPTVLLGIIGARLYHVLTHLGDYTEDPRGLVSALFVWEGGLAIFGSMLFGAVGIWLGCRWTGIRFWSFVDALAPGLLIAQVFGRLGNYFNQELFGLPTDLPWGLRIDPGNAAIPVGLPEDTLFHPTFLYEMIWNTAGALILVFVLERAFRLQWGKAIGFYLVWYGIGRSVFETIRLDASDVYLGIRTNVWAAFAAILIGAIILLVQSKRHTGAEPGPYVAGRGPSQQGRVESAEVYSDRDEDLAAPDAEPARGAATRR
ncbi:prolipoprotein diacylglyceryl transferase [Arenivirga flava]|uniref:Phosphatidylglycerol--prolipoprotein diacylglyceryl transferase n=1 Tax=Arenivirga flava TaxID=1930060 RepID=A0AA37XAQ6_9MICO|nr:prolipoprotein diacylglyceryl transferase [Arenivirga flava]GMA27571.1 prolipoprotein diacylglyceryl transferase [Arenivirga flava]